MNGLDSFYEDMSNSQHQPPRIRVKVRAPDPEPVVKCRNPLCDRFTGQMNYCCPACANAHYGRYEIHESGPLGHSEKCNLTHSAGIV